MKSLKCSDCGLHILSEDPKVEYCKCEIAPISTRKRKNPVKARHIAREVYDLIMAMAQRESDIEWARTAASENPALSINC